MNWIVLQSPLWFLGEIVLVDALLYLVVLKKNADKMFWLTWHNMGLTFVGLLLTMVFGQYGVGYVALLGFGIVLVARLVDTSALGLHSIVRITLIGALLAQIGTLNQSKRSLERLMAFHGKVQSIDDISQVVTPITQATVVHNARIEADLTGRFEHEQQVRIVAPLVDEGWDISQPVTAWIDIRPVDWFPWPTMLVPEPKQLKWNGRLYPIFKPLSPTAESYRMAVMDSLSTHQLIGNNSAMVYQTVTTDQELVQEVQYFIGIARFFLWFRFIGAVVMLTLTRRLS